MAYIEREAAIALYEDDAVDMSVLKVPVPVIIQNLKDIPAADVVPVVRGKWILHDEAYDMESWECSACAEEFCMIEGTPADNGYYFCPNCGARMDGDANV